MVRGLSTLPYRETHQSPSISHCTRVSFRQKRADATPRTHSVVIEETLAMGSTPLEISPHFHVSSLDGREGGERITGERSPTSNSTWREAMWWLSGTATRVPKKPGESCLKPEKTQNANTPRT
jgi:hypothetical protein